MFADELAKAVKPAVRTCQQRSAVQVVFDVFGELKRRSVSPAALLAHGHERNPLELAAQLPGEGLHARLTGGSDGRCGISELKQARARTRRILLADDSLDFVLGPARQHRRI